MMIDLLFIGLACWLDGMLDYVEVEVIVRLVRFCVREIFDYCEEPTDVQSTRTERRKECKKCPD